MKKLTTILALILILTLVVCSAVAETALERVKAAGKLVVGTELLYPPYDYLDDNAQPDGCDMWLAQQIADGLGVELVVKDMAFDGIIPAVISGQVDIGIAAFTMTPERALVIDFSHQYELSNQLLIVKKGNAELYSTKEALAGLRVGAQTGTVQSQLVESALPDSELFELQTYPELGLETSNGNIAGFVVDQAVGESMMLANTELEAANFTFTAEEASFGKAAIIKKDSEDLVEAVNVVIDQVVSDGTYQAAYDAAVEATSGK